MRNIFKNLIFCSTLCLTTLPIVSCGNKQTKDESKTIEILSNIDDLTVMEDEHHLSQPLQAKCYGPDKKEKELDIKFRLSIVGNDKLPNWIYLTDNNEIQLMGGKSVGTYVFNLLAYNDEANVYSKTKTFKVTVVEERHIIPDSLDIVIENDRYCMYGEQTILPIKVIPSKEGIEEKYLLNNCNFKVNVVTGYEEDLDGKKLFKISDSTIDPDLIVSDATDITYTSDYRLQIEASLIEDPEVKIIKTIDLHIDNIRYQVDPENLYVYTRSTVDDDWELASAPSTTKSLADIKSFIQNKPVSKVTKNFCDKSSITNLITAALPESIVEIGDYAFAGQTSFSVVSMPKVKKVGNYAFYGDKYLAINKATDYPSFEWVGDSAFENCSKFILTTLQDSTWIGDFAFKNAGLSTFQVGEKCEYLGQESFANCTKLTTITVLAHKPPILGGANFSKSDALEHIYVLADYLDDYKANSYWKEYAQKIEGI